MRFVRLNGLHEHACFLVAGLFDPRGSVIRQTLFSDARKEFAAIGTGTFGVHVQRPVKELVRRLPLAVFQRHFAAFE